TVLAAAGRGNARAFQKRKIQPRPGRSDRRSQQDACVAFSEKIDIFERVPGRDYRNLTWHGLPARVPHRQDADATFPYLQNCRIGLYSTFRSEFFKLRRWSLG